MSETVEFDCVDCGAHVYAFGIEAVPEDRRCAVCHWKAEVPELQKKSPAQPGKFGRKS